ncbi:MAG: DUF4249 domain-containing protein [Prolixibacteraceae bacterium]
MKQEKLILLFTGLVFLVFSSCIERFYIAGPEEIFIPKLVINGTITTDKNEHEIVVSMTSSPEDPKFVPVSGCNVRVEDDRNNRYSFYETGKAGHYSAVINSRSLIPGTKFRLFVLTPEGKQIVSSGEELLPCPEINAVYSQLETKPTANPDESEFGLQFYLDFSGNENFGNFYLWKLEETYEYHSTWPVTRYMDRTGVVTLKRSDYSNFVCYKTDTIQDIFTLSTRGLNQNTYKKYPLHFVNDKTQRLMYGYSLLVRQYSLSENAFNFWNNLKKNNKESVDLFGKQPAIVKGNLTNLNDSAEHILGYFGVSSVASCRIFVPAVNGLSFNDVPYCKVTPPAEGVPLPEERPLYWTQGVGDNGEVFWGFADTECFICTLLGGTTVKPSYWETK